MKRIKDNDNATIVACYIGYITQAIVNNFVPLLFVTFQKQFGIALDKIGLLISVNFGVQLLVDLLAAGLVEKVGERKTMITAHLCSGTGLLLLAFLPWLFPVPYIGLLIGIVCYAIGGGLIEVMLSPIVEACPTKNKEAVMSSLHSFYCWGHVGVVLISTLYFAVFGTGSWWILACIWAVIPFFNTCLFFHVPIRSLVEEGKSMGLREIFRERVFYRDGLCGSSGAGHEPVGKRLCGNGTFCQQDSRGSGGAVYVCGLYGCGKSLVWGVFREDPAP